MKSFLKKWSGSFGKSEIIISPHQINWIASGLLFFGLISFTAGYFWGQKKAVEYFIKKIEEDSFADRISYALYTMNDRDSVEFEGNDTADSIDNESTDVTQIENQDSADSEEEGIVDSGEKIQELTTEHSVDNIPTLTLDDLQSYDGQNLPVDIVESQKENLSQNVLDEINKSHEIVYLARLAGFGTLQAARVFLQRIQVIDKNASLIEHVSTTPKGKKRKWFQVVTGEFKDKNNLDLVVRRIKNKEFISDVQIIEKKKG